MPGCHGASVILEAGPGLLDALARITPDLVVTRAVSIREPTPADLARALRDVLAGLTAEPRGS